MSGRGRRIAGSVWVALVVLVSLALAETAQAAVTVSRAEVSGTRLRIEGRAAPSRPITVDGVAMATSSSSGSYRIDRSGYTRPPDCTVEVSDGSPSPPTVRLSGCTVSTPPAAAALGAISVVPSSVPGGQSAAATVTLTAPAPAGGAVVALSSSDPVVTARASLTVPAGATSATEPGLLATSAVTTTRSATISATYLGVTRTAVLTVLPPAPPPPPPPPPPPSGVQLESLLLDPATLQTGSTHSSATLWFTAPTPPEGAEVSLRSSNTAIATVPASVTVPGFSSSGAFPVTVAPSAVGTTTISATYGSTTRSAVLTVTSQSLFRIITTSPLPDATVGANYAGFIEACCGQGTPYRWSLVSGTVPAGLRFAGDDLRLSRTTGVTGVPTRVETTTFTVRARDGAGNTATATFTLSVGPAAPLVVTNQSGQLTDATVGAPYATGVFAGGGVAPYTWSLVAGSLPPGLSLQASPGRVQGTPTTAGSYAFTLRVVDSGGQSATQAFTLRVVTAP